MSVPLSDTHLAAYRDLSFLDGAITQFDQTAAAVAATRVLVREIDRLRAELLDFTHPVATCSGCHHIAPWHVGELGKTERACTQRDCNCTDLIKES